jgi:Na+-transporting methylmalonyl-CoA/oxaloacetate decarboxylase gamma subunit
MAAVWIAGILGLVSGALALILQITGMGDLVLVLFILVIVCALVAVFVGRKYTKTEKRKQATIATSMALIGFLLVVIANGMNMMNSII